MRRTLAFFGAALALTLASGAHAESRSFALLRKYCIATEAVSAQALRAADADGFQPVPDDVLAQMAAGQKLVRAAARVKKDNGETIVLLVGAQDGFAGRSNVKMDACTVTVLPTPNGVAQDAAAWVKVAPIMTDATQTLYLFIQGPGDTRTSVAGMTDDEMLELAPSGTLRMLSVYSSEGVVAPIVGVVRPIS